MKANLINIIARCNESSIRKAWIIEMSEADYECSESECNLHCPIYLDCISINDETHLLHTTYVNITPECIDCKVTLANQQYCSDCQVALDYGTINLLHI